MKRIPSPSTHPPSPPSAFPEDAIRRARAATREQRTVAADYQTGKAISIVLVAVLEDGAASKAGRATLDETGTCGRGSSESGGDGCREKDEGDECAAHGVVNDVEGK